MVYYLGLPRLLKALKEVPTGRVSERAHPGKASSAAAVLASTAACSSSTKAGEKPSTTTTVVLPGIC